MCPSPWWVARATLVRWTWPTPTRPVIMSVTNRRRRESVKGLATPAANVDNRRRIAVVSTGLPIAPASSLGCNTKQRRRFRLLGQLQTHRVNSKFGGWPLGQSRVLQTTRSAQHGLLLCGRALTKQLTYLARIGHIARGVGGGHHVAPISPRPLEPRSPRD